MSEDENKTMSENENNPFKKERKQTEWPEELLERFKMQAERTGENLEKVVEAFIKHIADEYECDDWKAEDTDLLIDWGEGMYTEDRSSSVSGGGGGTITFVGEWLGVEDKTRDRNEWAVRNGTKLWNENPNQAISDNAVGHYYKEDGVWVINTGNGAQVTAEGVDEAPTLGFRVGDDWLCLLSKAGRPYPPQRMGRYYRFLGNEKGAFVNKGEIQEWRVDLTGENRNLNIDTGVPVQIQIRLPTTKNEAFKDVLGTNYDFAERMKYTDEWLEEEKRVLLNPFKLWCDPDFVNDLYVPLTELDEAFIAGKRHFTTMDGTDATMGPNVIVKGTVTRMSTEGRESDYDESGRNFSLSLSSLGLQQLHGTKRESEIPCWISGACSDLTHPFHFLDTDGELWGYAEKSTILVYGRLKIKVNDGQRQPQITVFGTYADSRRSRRRVSGGDTDLEQFD